MKIKHFTVILTFLLTISVLISGWIVLYNSRADVRISLEKFKGSDEYLNDITVKGEIIDERQKLSFSLNKNKIENKYEYGTYGKIYPMGILHSQMMNFETDPVNSRYGYYDYQISADANTRIDYKRDQMAGLSGNWIYTDKLDVYASCQGSWVVTDMKIVRPQQDMAVFTQNKNIKESRTGSEPQGLFHPASFSPAALLVGENYYFATYTDENFIGTGGLYLVNSNFDSMSDNLMPIALENGEVQIRFSFVVDEKIVVLVTKGGKLMAHVYDTSQNRKLGEINIDDSEAGSTFDGVQSNGYAVIRQRLPGYEDHNKFYVVDINKLSMIDSYMKDEAIINDQAYPILYKVLYKNDMLFILTHRYPGHGVRQNEEILIIACKNGVLLCESVLRTDLRNDPAGIQSDDGYYLSPRVFQNIRME